MLENEKNHIQEAQRGNQESFGLLYGHYLPQIYRFIFLKVSSQAEAEDLTHEVFLSAWQNLKNYKYKGFPFSSWLYQIARNETIDFYRTSKKNIPLENVAEDKIQLISKTPDQLNAELELEKIKKFLQSLKPDYQEVIIMRFIEELSHEEIAHTLNKSQGAIRLTQHRALKELRNLYNEELKNYGIPLENHEV